MEDDNINTYDYIANIRSKKQQEEEKSVKLMMDDNYISGYDVASLPPKHLYQDMPGSVYAEQDMSTSLPKQQIESNTYLELQQKNTAAGASAGWVGGGEMKRDSCKTTVSEKRVKRCLRALVVAVFVVVLIMIVVALALAVLNYSQSMSEELSELNEEVNILSGRLNQLRNESQEEISILSGRLNQLRNESQETDEELLSRNSIINNELGQLINETEKELVNKLSDQLEQLRNETIEGERELLEKNNILNSELDQLRNETQQTKTELTSDISLLNIQHQESLSSTKDNITQVIDSLNAIRNGLSSVQVQLHCGAGPWHRIAYLNMSDPSQQCPSVWTKFSSSGVRTCRRPDSSSSSCPSEVFATSSTYQRVCGRVIGYQCETPDGFNSGTVTTSIDSAYIDGVSITYGQPRNHIWSYVAGVSERSSLHAVNNCPCSTEAGSGPQSFVGENYYCESGNPNDTLGGLYSADRLWDGKQCEGTCCSDSKSPPWFSVRLSNPTTENIEVRICGDEPTANENTPIELLELYVQ